MLLIRCFNILGLLFLLLCSIGCQTKSQTKSLTLLLDWLPNPDHVPLFVGEKLGFFVEESIDLNILKLIDPPSSLPYLQSKKADVILYYMPYTLMAAGKEKNLKVLGILIEQPLDGFMFLESPSLKTMQDLHQKTLGVCPGAKIASYVHHTLQKEGIVFSSIQKLEIDPSLALYTKMVDAVAGVYWNVEPFQLQSLGVATRFVKMTELGVPFYHELIFVTREDVLENDPSLRPRFQKALQKSIQYCQSHPEEAFQLYLQANPDKLQKTVEWEHESWKATVSLLASSQDFQESLFQNYMQWMFDHQIIEERIDVRSLIR
jgi:NitT/TauT family transport system substrate-binding protein